MSDSITATSAGSIASPTTPHCRPASEVVAEILKVAHRLRSVLSDHFSEFALTDVRFSVMQIIRNSPEGECSQARLAEELDQSESSISTLVERMRSSHLLYRLRSQQDRRKRALMLTDRGRQLLEDVECCHDQRMATLLSCFGEEQLEQFSTLLKQLQEKLEVVEKWEAFEREAASSVHEQRKPAA